jgi:hypothetical protein
MNRSDIAELHYIAPIVNVPSILRDGILSHNRAKRVGHDSVAMSEIQERRKDKQIPRARHLHDYANVYFDAHNPMLSKLRSKNNAICVLKINPAVLDIPDVIIADQNAASDWVRFFTVTDGLNALDRDRVFARYWKHQEDMIDEWRHKAEKCAEVLVPDRVSLDFITGAYVVDNVTLIRFRELNSGLPVSINSGIFF